jgi:hypothetical protein
MSRPNSLGVLKGLVTFYIEQKWHIVAHHHIKIKRVFLDFIIIDRLVLYNDIIL